MLEIRNIQTTTGHRKDHFIDKSPEARVLDAKNLMLFPALIDPYALFNPGKDDEEFSLLARSFIRGGITTLIDRTTPITSLSAAKKQTRATEAMFKKSGIPLHYYPCLTATPGSPIDAKEVKKEVAGLKIDLCDKTALPLFQQAKSEDLLLILSATCDLEKALLLCETTPVRLYISQVNSKKTLSLITTAKKKGLPVFAEVSLHDLFFSKESALLWEGIHNDAIDVVASHFCPESFPLLLNAHYEGKLNLEEIVSLTHTRIQEIFRLPLHHDLVLVDLEKTQTIKGKTVVGAPRYIIVQNRLFEL